MHKESTRLRIVDAATELFRKTSRHATNVNDLGREAGVNEATVYQHVDTKEQIAVAAVARFRPYHKRIVADLRADGRLRAVGKDDALARDLQDDVNATLVVAKLERSPARIKAGGEHAVRCLTN